MPSTMHNRASMTACFRPGQRGTMVVQLPHNPFEPCAPEETIQQVYESRMGRQSREIEAAAAGVLRLRVELLALLASMAILTHKAISSAFRGTCSACWASSRAGQDRPTRARSFASCIQSISLEAPDAATRGQSPKLDDSAPLSKGEDATEASRTQLFQPRNLRAISRKMLRKTRARNVPAIPPTITSPGKCAPR